MAKLAEALGRFIAPIIAPIIMKCLEDFFSGKAEVAKPNPGLQSLFDDDELRRA